MKTGGISRGILVGLFAVAVGFAGCGGGSSLSADLGSGSGTGGTGVSNTVSSPSEMGVGDIMPVQFTNGDPVTVSFEGVDSSSEFILVTGSSNASGSGTMMQLSTDLAAPHPGISAKGMEVSESYEDTDFSAGDILDAWLRVAEADLMYYEPYPLASTAKAMVAKAAAVGDVETFRVLANLSSVSSYVEVEAEAECVGSNVVVYVDTRVGADQLSASDVSQLCSSYDDVAGSEVAIFGDISDVDGDGKLAVLMTPQINYLGSLGGGIITGYFYAGDLYPRSGSNPVSNYREVIYTLVPDPSGVYGTAISNSFAVDNLLPAVFPHELQHAISYNQHVFVNGGAPESNWLNEGLSHLAEDIMGYGVENPSRYAMFLANPSTTGLITLGSPNLLERGAAYLFLRFLYEQSSDGNAFLGSIVQTSETGVENIEAAFNGPDEFNQFSEFFGRWTVAIAMTDRGISSDSRYIYAARSFNSLTGNWEGACIDCDPDDGRGTTLDGVHLSTYNGYHTANIDAAAAKYYRMSTIPDQMVLQGSSGGGNFGMLIRIQ